MHRKVSLLMAAMMLAAASGNVALAAEESDVVIVAESADIVETEAEDAEVESCEDAEAELTTADEDEAAEPEETTAADEAEAVESEEATAAEETEATETETATVAEETEAAETGIVETDQMAEESEESTASEAETEETQSDESLIVSVEAADDPSDEPATVSTVYSGTCGENVTWTLDEDGTLRISGTGAMENFDWSEDLIPPWNDYCTSIVTIIIEDGVTTVGERSFVNYSYSSRFGYYTSVKINTYDSLTSVIIGDSVTEIGKCAFQCCDTLVNVTIGSSVTTIGQAAFRYCESIEEISIPISVTTIAYNAFNGCSELTDVYYEGSESDWALIDIGENNTDLTEATIHYESTWIALQITSQPEDFSGELGTVATFTVVAEGTGLTYQWQYSDDDGASWTDSTATTANMDVYKSTLTAARDGRMVRCVVTDSSGDSVTSDTATMTVEYAEVSLAIISQPTDYKGELGSKATFTIEAEGNGLTYQWQYSDDSGKTWNNSTATTAKAATYISTLTASRDGRMVRCIVTDASGASLTSEAATMTTVTTESAITITSQPTDYTGEIGSKATFTIIAEGNELTYLWQYSDDNGATWTDSTATTATAVTYISTLTASRDGRMVRCIVTDADGNSVASDAATMTAA